MISQPSISSLPLATSAGLACAVPVQDLTWVWVYYRCHLDIMDFLKALQVAATQSSGTACPVWNATTSTIAKDRHFHPPTTTTKKSWYHHRPIHWHLTRLLKKMSMSPWQDSTRLLLQTNRSSSSILSPRPARRLRALISAAAGWHLFYADPFD